MVSSHRYCTKCGVANQAQDAFCFACGQPLQATPPSLQYPVAGSATTTSTGLLIPNLKLKQRYRIIGPLGQGGFGAVYKAEDVQLGNRLLAVKEMSQSSLSQQEIAEAAENFKREALLLAALKHPNLPSIYDHFSEAGRWYLVMDFLEGETLEDHLKKEPAGHLSVEETLQLGMQLCTVLNYLHSRQPPIIFRDLKPANIMLTLEEHLYLIDFGIARHFKLGQTKDTIAFGSPGYAAPEQYGKAQTTAHSDIYSLGATLYQLLTAIDPSHTPFQFAPLQLPDQPTPPGLERLIMQMLEMNENKRPASMIVVKQELQDIIKQQTAGQLNISQLGTLAHQPQFPGQMIMLEPQKNWIATALLCQFLGWLGVHRFYTGHVVSGIFQLLTFGGFGIWVLIDIIFIITGIFKDKYGRPLYHQQVRGGNKSWVTTALLCQFLGWLGVHRFYTGHVVSGIFQLLTFGGFGIWALIDLIMIYVDNFTDSNGMPLTRM